MFRKILAACLLTVTLYLPSLAMDTGLPPTASGISAKVTVKLPSYATNAAEANTAKVEAGDLIVLDASQSDATTIHWVLANSNKAFHTNDAERTLGFATGTPGRYIFVLFAVKVGADNKPITLATNFTVIVGDPPTPGPGPTPPDPDGPLPEGKFGLAGDARRWFKESIKHEGAKAQADDLAKGFAAMQSKVAAEAIKTVDEAKTASRDENRTRLGDATDSWRPWFVKLKDRLDILEKDNKLQTAADYGTAFEEISAGLAAAAKLP